MSRTVYYDHSGNEIDPPKADTVKPSNADRIRSMADEELAKRFSIWCWSDDWCKHQKKCEECWLDWLKEEVSLDG